MTDAMRLKERGNSLLANGSNRGALEAYVEGMEPAPPLGFLPVMDLLVGLVAEAVGFVWTWGLGWVTIRGRFGRLWI